MLLPLTFGSGMALLDTLDGIMMVWAYGWAMVYGNQRRHSCRTGSSAFLSAVQPPARRATPRAPCNPPGYTLLRLSHPCVVHSTYAVPMSMSMPMPMPTPTPMHMPTPMRAIGF